MDRNMLLVKTIEKFPCLYNYNLPEYHRKDVTDKAWDKVAKETNLDAPSCREKWKSLRYGLSRSIKPNAGSEKKKYYLHYIMEFVIPYLNIPKRPVPLTANNAAEENARSPQCSDYDESYYEPPEKKGKEDPEKLPKESPAQSSESPDDSRKMFLLSMVPEINKFTENQMRYFRRKVLTLIDEIVVYK